jgi:carbamoyl-phosphate synthase large subunit
MASSGASGNFLLTFSGRKRYVHDILSASVHAARVVAADSDPQAPIRHAVDLFELVPPVKEEAAYLDAIRGVCERHAVDCILPLNDLDLLFFAERAELLAKDGVRVLGAPAAVVATTRDKLLVGPWLARHGIASPPTVLADRGAEMALEHGFPLVAKARYGQGSERLRVCREVGDLERLDADQVVQPLRSGQEHNLDILRAPGTGVVSVVPKLKLEMRGGSTHHAVSVDAPGLVDLGVRLGEALGHVGSVDVDVMVGERGTEVLDVNPRVGGGFPFAVMCCPAYVDALLLIGLGESPSPFLGEYQRGVRGVRETVYVTVS